MKRMEIMLLAFFLRAGVGSLTKRHVISVEPTTTERHWIAGSGTATSRAGVRPRRFLSKQANRLISNVMVASAFLPFRSGLGEKFKGLSTLDTGTLPEPPKNCMKSQRNTVLGLTNFSNAPSNMRVVRFSSSILPRIVY